MGDERAVSWIGRGLSVVIDVSAGTKLASRLGPLSLQQAEMVEGMRTRPDCASRFHLTCVFDVRGALEVRSLVTAIEDVTRRHPMLRMMIERHGSGYVQRVAAGPLSEVAVGRLGSRSLGDLVTEVISDRPSVDDVLAGAPLFRAGIWSVDAGRHVLIFQLHHLVYDGWSLKLLWRDLAECYAAVVDDRPARLPSLTASYLDFARTQRHSAPRLTPPAVAFWRTVTEGCPRELKWQRPSTSINSSYATEVLSFGLSDSTLWSLRSASRQARVSPFLVLLSATAVAIAMTIGQWDVLLGTDMANRQDIARQELVGLFLNTRLSRVRMRPGQRFSDVVLAVREGWLVAEEHVDAYMGEVLAALGNPPFTRVDMWPGDPTLGLDLSNTEVAPVPLADDVRYWRDVGVTWRQNPGSVTADIRFRSASVSREAAAAVRDESLAILGDPAGVI